MVQELKQARLAAGLTSREVAERLGLDGSQVAHLEAGRRVVSPEWLDRWRAALRELLVARGTSILLSLTKI